MGLPETELTCAQNVHLINYIFCVPASGAMHRERRNFLRGAMNELLNVLEDEPGLLGPKVSLLFFTGEIEMIRFNCELGVQNKWIFEPDSILCSSCTLGNIWTGQVFGFE